MLVSKPPRYSDVINCCVNAVLPTPSLPITITWDTLHCPVLFCVPKLSFEELESNDNCERCKYMSPPPSEDILFVLRDRIVSVLLLITPFEFTSNILTVYVFCSWSAHWFHCNRSWWRRCIWLRFGLLISLLTGILDVRGRIHSSNSSSKLVCLSLNNDLALSRHVPGTISSVMISIEIWCPPVAIVTLFTIRYIFTRTPFLVFQIV